MSHRHDCPSRYEAEREGERDYERRGYRSYATPYDDTLGREGCREAARAYDDGNRRAEQRAEEEAAQERSERRAAEQRRMAREYEESMYIQQCEQREQEELEQHQFWEDMHYAMLEVEQLHAEF